MIVVEMHSGMKDIPLRIVGSVHGGELKVNANPENVKMCRAFLDTALKAIDRTLELEASGELEVGKVYMDSEVTDKPTLQ